MPFRKFFAYYPDDRTAKVRVAALGRANSSNFEQAAKLTGLCYAAISEQQALTLLELDEGVGAACYSLKGRNGLSEAQKQAQAMSEQTFIAKMVGLYYSERPLLLEPIKELIEA